LLPLMASLAEATWSIVVVDTRTGEVAVASATCLENFNLEAGVPVVIVGKGAGAAQSLIDAGAINRRRMRDGLRAGAPPEKILYDLVANGTSPQRRQYGISAFSGPSVTFTGTLAGLAAGGVTGEVDGLRYAIQGNVLVGAEVWHAAEVALVETPGDVGQKILAAMEAARSQGGDGRCSCSVSAPTSCGAPPPGFVKSAHVGFVIVARVGDTDGACTGGGCAQGDYYMNLNVIGGANDPDPVFTLFDLYADWRANLAGRPDHVLSEALPSAHSLPADGITTTTVTVRLVDVDGVPLARGGAEVRVRAVQGTASDEGAAAGGDFAALAVAGPVVDHDDGTYSFELRAGTRPGTARFVVTADDGAVTATLFPFLEVRLDPVRPLHAGLDAISVSEGAGVPFVLDVPEAPGASYFLLASGSGTRPGVHVGGALLPLNPDLLFHCSVVEANSASLPGSFGALDADGRAQAMLVTQPGELAGFVGGRVDWAALVVGAGVLATNAVGFDVLP
jgi:hypothetical protein